MTIHNKQHPYQGFTDSYLKSAAEEAQKSAEEYLERSASLSQELRRRASARSAEKIEWTTKDGCNFYSSKYSIDKLANDEYELWDGMPMDSVAISIYIGSLENCMDYAAQYDKG